MQKIISILNKRNSMKKAIITGANGQLGNAFAEGLVKKGYFVYAIDINI